MRLEVRRLGRGMSSDVSHVGSVLTELQYLSDYKMVLGTGPTTPPCPSSHFKHLKELIIACPDKILRYNFLVQIKLFPPIK
jgi:hypothetical protein